ncbi:hypothetical protein DP117_27365 [Brasilonema sp. UFV-L1]|nr:hypothetical protein [Brasilonema sp. UFV-L1]
MNLQQLKISVYPSSKKQKCFFTSIGNAIAFLGRFCHYRDKKKLGSIPNLHKYFTQHPRRVRLHKQSPPAWATSILAHAGGLSCVAEPVLD